MQLWGWELKRVQPPQDPSPGYAEDLKKFSISPSDVIEPISVDPRKYIVLIIKKNMWATYRLAKSFQVPDGAQEILSRATFIQSVPMKFPGNHDQLAFRRIVGTSIELALEGDLQKAREMLTEAEGYVARRAAETSRFWYLQSSVVTAALFFAFGVASERLKWGWPTGDGSWEHLGMATAFGALGALFSFLYRIRKHTVDPGAGWKAHYGDAFLRIVLGALGALIFAIGIRSKFVLNFPDSGTTPEQSLWLLYLLCVAAGFSERLVPEFLQQVKSRALKDPDDPEADQPLAEGEPESGQPGSKPRKARPK